MSSSPEPPGPAGTEGPGRPETQPVCPRHTDRVSYVRCQRCERPVCPQCQRPAAVGVHCVDCVRAQPAVTARTVAGAPLQAGRPLVTEVLLGVLVAVWVLQLLSPLVTGALSFVPVLSRAEPWRFLTLGLVHSPGLPLHLMLNGFALWVVGRELEGTLGRWRYGVLLLLSTVASAVGVLWLTPVTPGAWDGATVGASGAIFGLLGTGVVLGARRGDAVGRQVLVLLLLAGAGFLIPGISWQGHVGGLLGGLAVGAVLLLAPKRRRTTWQVVGLVAVLLVLVALTLLRWTLVPATALY